MLYSQVTTFKFILLIDNNSKENLKLAVSGEGLINITTETETIVATNLSHTIRGNMSFYEFSTQGDISLEICDFNHNPLYRSTINENGFNESKKNEDIRKKEGKLGSNKITLLEFSNSNAKKNNWFKRIILKIKGLPNYENLEVGMIEMAKIVCSFFLKKILELVYNRAFNRNNTNNRNINNRN
jgi:hypothetical protein